MKICGLCAVALIGSKEVTQDNSSAVLQVLTKKRQRVTEWPGKMAILSRIAGLRALQRHH